MFSTPMAYNRKKHLEDKENPTAGDMLRMEPVTDIRGLLDRLDKYGDPGDAPARLVDAAQLYLLWEHGPEAVAYKTELPADFPHRETFQGLYEAWTEARDSHNRWLLQEICSREAGEILCKEYPELCTEKLRQIHEQSSMRWPENDDFKREQGREMKL